MAGRPEAGRGTRDGAAPGGRLVRPHLDLARDGVDPGGRAAGRDAHPLPPAPGEASAWHRVTSDEIWMWHGPDSVVLELGGDGDQPEPARRSPSVPMPAATG
ncbi:cupin domain-containing protein [Curtobacterium sp. 9128]|uniref:cupin domain-containing protein n=1 Tax=Curtobacterium sp. 9128 TaxID=1793722 RepID=UPI0032B20407